MLIKFHTVAPIIDLWMVPLQNDNRLQKKKKNLTIYTIKLYKTLVIFLGLS